ncbi:MAG: AI-2E family transporter [Pseudomonadota bacterium]
MGLSTTEQIRYWSLGFVVLLVFLWIVGDTILPFVVGAALAYFLDPVADRLETWGFSRVMATIIITFAMILMMIAFLLILTPLLVDEARRMVESIPQFAATAREALELRFPNILDEGSPIRAAIEDAVATLQSKGPELANQLLAGGLAVVDFLILLVVAPVVAFYLLVDWDRMIAVIDGWLPREHAPVIRKLAGQVDDVLAGFVRGQLTVCAILGLFYAAALSLVGLQFGLIIGFFAGLISFIPFVGSIVGGTISIGVALFQFWNDPVWIAAVAGIFLAGQGVEGNFLTPKLVGSSVGLHPVWLMFALAAFGALMGFTGMLIAVPLAATIGVMLRFGLEQYLSSRLYRGPEQDSS